MEITSFILSLIFVLLTVTSLFVAYSFWVSKNGQLRKLMIQKHLCLAFMFLIFGILVYWPMPNRLYVIIGCFPYMVSMVRLIIYFLKAVKLW